MTRINTAPAVALSSFCLLTPQYNIKPLHVYSHDTCLADPSNKSNQGNATHSLILSYLHLKAFAAKEIPKSLSRLSISISKREKEKSIAIRTPLLISSYARRG